MYIHIIRIEKFFSIPHVPFIWHCFSNVVHLLLLLGFSIGIFLTLGSGLIILVIFVCVLQCKMIISLPVTVSFKSHCAKQIWFHHNFKLFYSYLFVIYCIFCRSRRRLQRRVYHNKGPNYLWHLDAYDKLKPYGICIHGCIDGFSRHIMWLKAGTVNKLLVNM